MKKIVRPTLALALLLVSSMAQAVTIESSTTVSLTLRECVAGDSPCDSIGPSVHKTIEGLPGNNSSRGTLEKPDYGAASGHAKLTGMRGGSELNGHAASLPGTRNAGTIGVLQKYTNEGSDTEELIYSGTLTYEQTVPEENSDIPEGSPGRSFSLGMLGAVRMNLDAIEAGTTAEDNWAAVTEGPGEDIAFTDLGADQGASPSETGSGSIDLSVSLTVAPGESVWLWAMMQVLAANGAEVGGDFATRLEPSQTESP